MQVMLHILHCRSISHNDACMMVTMNAVHTIVIKCCLLCSAQYSHFMSAVEMFTYDLVCDKFSRQFPLYKNLVFCQTYFCSYMYVYDSLHFHSRLTVENSHKRLLLEIEQECLRSV